MFDLGWPFQPREEPKQPKKGMSRPLWVDGASSGHIRPVALKITQTSLVRPWAP